MDTEVGAALERLECWGRDRDWVGADPYEGLNSPLGRIAGSKRTRQAVIQAYKRAPLSPPWPLRARSQPNSKALALALSGYSTEAGGRLPGAEEFRSRLPGELARMSLDSSGGAWGYHFDVQTRHLFYSRDTPNAVATCFVVGALCDAATAFGEQRLASLALSARPYLLSLLCGHGERRFFGYVAEGSELIHNANMLVSGALARLDLLEPDSPAADAVAAAVETTLSAQRSDGLWPYGEAENLGWVDNFHTAYVLESLCHVEATFGMGGDALELGARVWIDRFFERDGWARYYPDRRFPLEPHSYATAVDLLCTLAAAERGPGSADETLSMAMRVADSAIRELWLPDEGRFAFRRTARLLNRREFMRWTNAPMFRALANLCSAVDG